jgi:catechol 2,3-dioxygenase-like lactoylglutathione lyase family enzyme
MGHAVLLMPDIDVALTFYRDLLGFRISDFMGPPVSVYFMHVNTRHHSLAIAQSPRGGMHHLMMEFYSLDDVGQSYDIAQREDRVAVKFGRHAHTFRIPDRAWMGWPRSQLRLAAGRVEIRRQLLGTPRAVRIAG